MSNVIKLKENSGWPSNIMKMRSTLELKNCYNSWFFF